MSKADMSIPYSVEKIFASGKIPHAFMIEGCHAEERQALAGYIAKACVCEGENPPCGDCRQCITAKDNSNPDISFISAESGKKNISVAQIRQMRQNAFVKPHSAMRKVFIIGEAHQMNEAAQNALLKVLEEPPESVVFILAVSSRTLCLDTVVSRCAVISLSGGDGSQELTDAADFLKLVFSGSQYDMLLFLNKFEKDRKATEEFLLNVRTESVLLLRKCYNLPTRAKILSGIYSASKTYLDLLKTNINLSLLFCRICADIKLLTEN